MVSLNRDNPEYAEKLNLIWTHYPELIDIPTKGRVLEVILSYATSAGVDQLEVALAHGCSCDTILPRDEVHDALGDPTPIRRISALIATRFSRPLYESECYRRVNAVVMLRRLLNTGAHPDGKGEGKTLFRRSGLIPLSRGHFAIDVESEASHDSKSQAALLLLQYGASVNVSFHLTVGELYSTPLLHGVCGNRRTSRRFIEQLLQFGADVGPRSDSERRTALHHACDGIKKGFPADKKLVELLLRYGVEVNAVDSMGLTAFQLLPHAIDEKPSCLETKQVEVMLARRAHQERRGRIRSGGEKGEAGVKHETTHYMPEGVKEEQKPSVASSL